MDDQTRTPKGQPTSTARRAWRTRPRRLAYAAVGATALAAGLVVACSERGPTAAVQPSEVAAAPPVAGGAAVSLTAKDVAWVGAAHNDGVNRVVRRARALYPGARAAAIRPTLCDAITTQVSGYLAEHGPRQLLVSRVGAAAEQVVTAAATSASCSAGNGNFGEGLGVRLAKLGHAPGARAAGRGLRAEASGDIWSLGPEAFAIVNALDARIDAMTSADALSNDISALEGVAQQLPSANEQAIVLSALSTARASAYNVEDPCTWGECGGGGGGGGGGGSGPPEPPIYETSKAPSATPRFAGGGTHVNKLVVKADAWGCLSGGAKAWFGGPQAVLTGCFVGGMIGSVGVIFFYMT